MALVKQKLVDELTKFLGGTDYPVSSADAAVKWANAYKIYAQDAESCGNLTPGVGNGTTHVAAAALLAAQLATGFVSGTPQDVAVSMKAGLDVYWPAIVFAGATPGVGLASLAVFFLVNMTNTLITNASEEDPTEAIDEIATRFEEYTTLVQASHVPPSACAGAIS